MYSYRIYNFINKSWFLFVYSDPGHERLLHAVQVEMWVTNVTTLLFLQLQFVQVRVTPLIWNVVELL